MFYVSWLSQFLLDKWLWAMTWGVYHIPINILLMIVLLKFVGRLRIIPSILLAFFSKLFSSSLYTIIVIFLVFMARVQFHPLTNEFYRVPVLLVCIYLGLVYTVLQSLFFVIVDRFYELNVRLMILITLVSNLLSALIVNKFLEYN